MWNLGDICELLGIDLNKDPRFDTPEKQTQTTDEWHRLVEPYFLDKTKKEWARLMVEKDILGGPVLTYPELFQDPQVVHQEMVMEVGHPDGGTFKTVGFPIKLSATPAATRLGVPGLGEHSGGRFGQGALVGHGDAQHGGPQKGCNSETDRQSLGHRCRWLA